MQGRDTFLVADLPIELWLDAFESCHDNGTNGLVRTCWPDGDSYIEQEGIVVAMFKLIRDEYGKIQNG